MSNIRATALFKAGNGQVEDVSRNYVGDDTRHANVYLMEMSGCEVKETFTFYIMDLKSFSWLLINSFGMCFSF